MTEIEKLKIQQKKYRKKLNKVNARIRMLSMDEGFIITKQSSMLINNICNYFGIKRKDLLSNCRYRELQIPKRITYYLLREKFNLPLANIGGIFCLTHGAIIYGLKVFEKEKESKYIQDIINKF